MSSVPRTPPLAGDKPQPYIFLAGAGTPGYENWVHWVGGRVRCRLCHAPRPWRGTSPSPTFFWLVPAHQGMKIGCIG